MKELDVQMLDGPALLKERSPRKKPPNVAAVCREKEKIMARKASLEEELQELNKRITSAENCIKAVNALEDKIGALRSRQDAALEEYMASMQEHAPARPAARHMPEAEGQAKVPEEKPAAVFEGPDLLTRTAAGKDTAWQDLERCF